MQQSTNMLNQENAELVYTNQSYWLIIEGDCENETNQRLPKLTKIRTLLEALYSFGRIRQYVCSYEKGSSNINSIILVYLTYVETEKVN